MWNVVKVETDNGLRVGIDEQEIGEVLASNLSYEQADTKCHALSLELGVPVYSEEDTFLG